MRVQSNSAMSMKNLRDLEQLIVPNLGSNQKLGITTMGLHPKTKELGSKNKNFSSTLNALNPQTKQQHQKFPVQGLSRSYFSLHDLNQVNDKRLNEEMQKMEHRAKQSNAMLNSKIHR